MARRAIATATIVTTVMLLAVPSVACKDDFERVIRDEDLQERLDWKFAQAFNNRCAAYLRNGDFDRAMHRTATRQSDTIQKVPSPSVIAVPSMPARATSTAPYRTSTRPYGSILT